jgi:hypothetical protein
MGTDGLFDNLYDVRIIEILKPFIRDNDELADPELIAQIIAGEAYKYSLEPQYLSPFAKGA